VTASLSDRIVVLSEGARFDVCAPQGAEVSALPAEAGLAGAITGLRLPGGGCLSVLKLLLTDACHYDCYYCANRATRPRRRTALKPEELARGFLDLHQRGLVQGLFLSSGIHGRPDETMGEMLTAAEIVREKHRFRGYLHLKVLPGASAACIERAVALADRVSVNVEAPTQQSLDRLATRKHLWEDIVQRMHWIRQAAERAGPGKLKSGQTTQFVVGPGGETDRQVLTTTIGLRESVGLRRAYFSAFSPISDTPLEGEPATPPLREHRLYQADWLLREYGFGLSELCFDRDGNLPLPLDPKLASALNQGGVFPIEVNTAARGELLRVPGIGPRTAGRILAARRQSRISELGELRRLGVPARAAPFVLCAGRRMGRLSDLLAGRDLSGEQLELAFA
jgi:predicted DNA-binding helix-hairpin-helix protein